MACLKTPSQKREVKKRVQSSGESSTSLPWGGQQPPEHVRHVEDFKFLIKSSNNSKPMKG